MEKDSEDDADSTYERWLIPESEDKTFQHNILINDLTEHIETLLTITP